MSGAPRPAGTLAAVLVLACAGPAAGPQATPGTLTTGVQQTPRPTAYARAIAPFQVLDVTGEPYEFPFLGGLEVPRPQFVDIDGDSDFDLFVQERSDELMFFENTGSPSEAHFVWRNDRFEDLVIGDWSRFVDMDADGDLDLFAEERYSHIRVYENRGTATDARFELVADSIRGPDGVPIFADRQNIPFFVDLDCDQMLDMFLGRIDGTVSRFESVSAPAPGAIPSFQLITDRFQEIEIVAQLGSARHGANSMVFTDLDRDDDLDLLWGDFFEPGLLLIENVGNCWSPNMRRDPVPVPATVDISTSGYNAAALADIDADGKSELFIGILGGAFNPVSTAVENFLMYREGPDGAFELETGRYLSTVDVGSETVPALGDVDGDGDLDLLLGSKVDPDATSVGRLYAFENIGSTTSPRLQMRGALPIRDVYHVAPELADLDDDGDLDLVLGNWRANLELWRNEGAATSGFPFVLVDSALAVLPRGANTVPSLGDVDGDGDVDLIVGEAAGNLNFYRNQGSRSEPRFVLEDEELGGIDVGRRAAPSLTDIDRDGDLDLLVGSEDGRLRLFLNRGDGGHARFEEEAGFVLSVHPYATPAWGDLDGDGDSDLVTGGVGGGFLLYERR